MPPLVPCAPRNDKTLCLQPSERFGYRKINLGLAMSWIQLAIEILSPQLASQSGETELCRIGSRADEKKHPRAKFLGFQGEERIDVRDGGNKLEHGKLPI
jgi:hypothetical protein